MGIVGLIILAVVALFVISVLANVVFDLFVPLLVWALIGWLAGKLLRGRGYGAVGNILLGIGGGVVGSLLFRLLHLTSVSHIWLIGNIVVGVVGAVVVIWVVRLLGNPRFGR